MPEHDDARAAAAPGLPRGRLLRWYRRHRRDLPWRRTRDPYAIWVSEVMLQQTRVDTVVPYYERFLAHFPTVAALARADEESVLRHWAGLGYYSRGRNLQRAARHIVAELDGRFPTQAATLRELPGVGEYTAAAVSSIAFGEAVPVIDGNVERVLSRFFAVPGDPRGGAGRARLRILAQQVLAPRAAGDHNQALMELGATVCTPRAPRCEECPLEERCAARRAGAPTRFPELPPRRPAITQDWVSCVPFTADGRAWLLPTPATSELLPGHWGFPLARLPDEASAERALEHARRLLRDRYHGLARKPLVAGMMVRHTITHRRLRVRPYAFPLPRPPPGGRPLRPAEAGHLAALFRKLFEILNASMK